MHKSLWSYFQGSVAFTFVAIIICYLFSGLQGAILAMILGVLETSLSVDNAVVNSKILKDMNEVWRRRFLTWGMVVAVFGMRIIFPILIVWCTSPLTIVEATELPFKSPELYANTLMAAHISIAGFGGTFLLMVFLSFFMDKEKEEHWIAGIEHAMAYVGKIGRVSGIISSVLLGAITSSIVIYIAAHLSETDSAKFINAAWCGLATFFGVELFSSLFDSPSSAKSLVKSGIASFIYLEILDASFSFDGVIGAFAVTDNIIIIALGLGIGAMFVRSLTVLMVDKDTLGSFKYLEHGAFWSIGVLAGCMFVGTFYHISELFTGLSAACILAISVAHSIFSKELLEDLV